MKLLDIIKQKTNYCDANNRLWQLCKRIVSDSIEHSKQISSQLSEYDIHDERHSEKVIEIIENILGDKLQKLSFYELLLLYLSAYLHDSGMALPKWEYEALKAVEGCDEYYDSTLNFVIKNDFKTPQTFDEIKKIINETNLFDYDSAKSYIFIENSIDKVIENISSMVRDYELFRNRYSTLLKQKTTSHEYFELSKIIRSEFIRVNHHKKAVFNIKNLRNKIKTAISPFYVNIFLQDLASICQAHGENLDFIRKLPNESVDWEGNKNNIQFLALILRLGDIIHFSSDRAPLSLYSEKQIHDENSLKHWKVKFQDVKYNITTIEKQILISFQAFCSEPEMYYFLSDYINGIDEEIRNFYLLKQNWERLENFDVYNLSLFPTVSREHIKYDEDVFIPDMKMKFTLNQAKILDLLMGVQLYKDKFACLREVYQNALDTSKCLLAYNKTRGIAEEINIEFGIGEEELEGITRKYIYCLDHGLGMDKYIVENYLLHIGNSYYKSKDFDEKNTGWKFDVKPTSQFGIGILSAYMIADKIGITSVYYENQQELSFILSGISERFYYRAIKISDKEKIGTHGTIVKLYLKDKYSKLINADFIPKMPLFLMGNNDDDIAVFDDVSKIKNNLFYILFRFIGIFHPDIPAVIKTPNEEFHELYQYNQVFEYKKFDGITKDDIENLVKQYHFWDGDNPYEKFIENIKYINNYVIESKTENITLYMIFSLPKKGIKDSDVKLLRYGNFLGNCCGSLCVDGICVEKNNTNVPDYLGFHKGLNYYVLTNFHGEKRPVLSIDRTSIIDFPNIDDGESVKLRDLFLNNIIEILKQHLLSENIKPNDKEFYLIYDFICSKYISIASKILLNLTESLEDVIFFPEEELKSFSINDIISEREIEIKNVNFSAYKEISRQIILGKCINAESIIVSDDNIRINSSKFESIPLNKYSYEEKNASLSNFAIRADKWYGKYSEYDVVSSLWPIINPNLFDILTTIHIQRNSISSHCKFVDSSGNAIQAIAQLNPTLINPSFGIGSKRKTGLFDNKTLLSEPDEINRNFWLFELSNHGETVHKEKRSPTLFVYIAPRKLDDIELKLLEECKIKDPIYYDGVKNGWSIYFLGAMQKYIITPGIVSRIEIEKLIPSMYKQLTPKISYYDTNGKLVL